MTRGIRLGNVPFRLQWSQCFGFSTSMNLGFDPVLRTGAGRAGGRSIRPVIHVSAASQENRRRTKGPTFTIASDENIRQTRVNKLKFLTTQRDLLWFAKRYLPQKGTYL